MISPSLYLVWTGTQLLANLGYFDERNPAVLKGIGHLIAVAHKKGIAISICGQAPSLYPDFTVLLVREEIDSISVNPDTVIRTRRLVATAESRLLLAKSRADERSLIEKGGKISE